MNKKIITLVFLIVVSSAFAGSCGGSAPKQDDTKNSGQNETETAAPEPDRYEDDLPDMDFNGEPFCILHFPSYTNAHGYLWTAEETGDIINDSVYKANTNVEDRLNITFEEIVCGGYTDATNMLKKSTAAGDNAYDYLMMADRDAFALAMEGKYYHTFDELPYVNLDKAYWDQSLKKTMTMGDTLYFTYGANMLSVYDFSCIMLFNKKIAEDLALDNIYQLVRDGKWTIDKMTEMAKAATADTDGDGVMNKSDRYGISSRGDYFYASFWVSDRIPMVEKDKDDLPYFNVPGNEKLFDLFAKLNEISASEYIWQGNDTGDTNPPMEMFSKGNALFFSSTTYTTLRLRGMEIDYGIIPYPTLETKEPGSPYAARAMGGFPILIPILSDPARGSAVMEALACQYQKHVIPAYYDNAVQIKATRDEESVEMIDMLLTNKFMDLGDSVWTSSVRHEYTLLFFKKQGETAQSKTESITPNVEALIQTAIDAFQSP